jgi:hypothetical protein
MNKIRLIGWLLINLVVAGVSAADTNSTVLYATGFEISEKFDPAYTLLGQNDWTGSGDGGNGLVNNYFPNMGQQAFIGYAPPTGTNESLYLWYPNSNTKTQYTRIRFSVDMAIVDSTNQKYDDFRWSTYNTAGDKLFTLNFDNYALAVTYSLDDTNGFISTGHTFTSNTLYSLVIDMDFKMNLWSAYIDDDTVVSNLPIVKSTKPLDFGDVDAVWVLYTAGSAGDNYMLFDNYTVLAVKTPLPTLSAPKFQTIQRLSADSVLLRLSGQTNQACRLDYSSDLKQWNSIKTGTFTSTGTLDVVDDGATQAAQRFYRVVYTQ